MIKSYVLRGGRVTAAQKAAYSAFASQYCIQPVLPPDTLDFAYVFGNNNPVICEIGFGMGSATVEIAKENPSVNYFGIEVFKAGVSKLILQIEKFKLKNIRVIEYDAAMVFENMIKDESLAGIHVFFPDPWPKKRHHKRRLIRRHFVQTIAKKLAAGGYFYMVTDWEDYALFALAELETALKNEYSAFAPSVPWRPQTEFEQKGILKNHKIFELFFKKIKKMDVP